MQPLTKNWTAVAKKPKPEKMDRNQNAVAIFDKHADRYQEKYMDVHLYHDTLDVFCDNIPSNAPILELACGPGNITKYLLSKHPDLKIFGTDLSPKMVTLAKTNNPEAEFALMDCRQIDTLENKYDAVMCGFCLPYLSKEEALALIGNATALLNPGGVIYLSTMEDDYATSGIRFSSTGDGMYMYFHEAGYLTQALENNQFKIILQKRQDYPTTDGTKTTDLILIAKK